MLAAEGRTRIATALVVLVLAVVALYPAWWNGFPLVFIDSGVYMGDWKYPGVPPFYPIFVQLTSLGSSLFTTITAHALITAWLLVITLRAAGWVDQPLVLLGLGLAVLLANQLPWLVSWLMPDVLAGLGAAAVCVLVLTPERLHRLEIAFLAGVVILAATSATVNIPLFAGLLLFALLAHGIAHFGVPPLAGASIAALALGIATGATLSANKLIFDHAALNSAGAAMTFSRFADTGIAQPVVRDLCAHEHFALCDHLDALEDFERERQTFLFDGVADATDARGAGRDDYAALVRAVVAAAWPAILREGLADAGRLLARPTLGIAYYGELVPYPLDTTPGQWLAARYPDAVEAYVSARQQQGELLAHFPTTVFAWSTYLGYAALLLLSLQAWRWGDRTGTVLGLSALAMITAELLLHGLLVGPYPRYHVKVAWLGWLFATVILTRRWVGSQRQTAVAMPT